MTDPNARTSEAVTAAVAQYAPGEDPSANRDAARSWIDAAASQGAKLIVLPEYAHYSVATMNETVSEIAEPIDGPFASVLAEGARVHEAFVVAGIVEATDSGVANTVLVMGSDGLVLAYRKVHLYDAFGARESEWLSAGDPGQLPVFDAFDLRIGVQTCYDLRFPEVSRRLVDAGADALVVPAQWARGPQKERQWSTLLAARAIESTAYVVAAGQAPPLGVGCSAILDPMGVPRASLGGAEGIVLAQLERAVISETRATNPSLANRRYGTPAPL